VGGNLSADSGNGNITQTGALSVTGTTGIAAGTGDVTLSNPGNDFQGAVSLAGDTVAIADANALTLGVVTTTGNLTVDSTGALDLGTTTVGGDLSADSGNGNITQTGVLNVKNATTLNAGTGTVALTDPANNLVNGVSVSAGASSLVGDQVGDARAAAGNATAGSGQDNSSTPSTVAVDTSEPKGPAPLTLGSPVGNSAGVSVEVQARPEAQTADMVAVSLPKNTTMSGMGFAFVLPASLTEGVPSQNAVTAKLSNGNPLPDWLQFNAQTMTFTASAVPDGAFPMRVLVTIGEREVIVTIFERSE
jgi:hypothetical protein